MTVSWLVLGALDRGIALVGIDAELIENDKILHNSAKRAKKPRNGLDNVPRLLRVAENAKAIGEVSCQRQHEEEQGETFAGLLPVVLDDLRNACAV